MIRPATSADAQAICDIYNPYIEDTVITFNPRGNDSDVDGNPITIVQIDATTPLTVGVPASPTGP